MSNIYKYGFFVLIIIIIAIVLLKGSTDGNKMYLDQLESKVEILNDNILRLEDENSEISTELSLKMDSISTLKGEVAEIEYKKRLLARYYEKKIRDIDKLNVSQLDSMFSTRYPR